LFYTEFNFEKMLQKVINVIGFKLEEKKQQFSLFLDSNIPDFLSGDEQRITQIITNLLTNAVKFTSENGSIWLKAYLESELDGTCKIRIEVRDTGIGIAPEHHNRLFSSFEQAETSTSRKFGGTGLGLAICKNIVELMGGHIWVESELGKGAAFIFTILLKRGAGKGVEILSELYENETDSDKLQSFRGHRLLLAEDMEINREIIIALLEPLEIEIECAFNGTEAVKMYTANPEKYDMIFMDMQMPQMDGLEATRIIREHEALKIIEKKNSIPIVAMTANVFKEDIEKCLDAGMNAHVGKPLDINEVMEILQQYLDKR